MNVNADMLYEDYNKVRTTDNTKERKARLEWSNIHLKEFEKRFFGPRLTFSTIMGRELNREVKKHGGGSVKDEHGWLLVELGRCCR